MHRLLSRSALAALLAGASFSVGASEVANSALLLAAVEGRADDGRSVLDAAEAMGATQTVSLLRAAAAS